ncbi:MAG: helix-turn-helix domain-containing protein, partial [Pseudorhodoplanes sp.]
EGPAIGVAEFPQIAALVSGGGAAQPDSGMQVIEHAPALVAIPEPFHMEPHHMATMDGPGMMTLLDANGQVRPIEDIESDVIRFAINHYRGQMSEVARRLRIGRSTLYRKLESLGLQDSGEKAEPEPVSQG